MRRGLLIFIFFLLPLDSYGHCVLRTMAQLVRLGPGHWPVRVCYYLLASGSVPYALASAFFGNAPGRCLAGLHLAVQLRAQRLAHCHAPASALPPGASLGGVAPPRDAILLVRAKRMQKRVKGGTPLKTPLCAGDKICADVADTRQAPSAMVLKSLREKRQRHASLPRTIAPAGCPRAIPVKRAGSAPLDFWLRPGRRFALLCRALGHGGRRI